jgi:hypothetical protein
MCTTISLCRTFIVPFSCLVPAFCRANRLFVGVRHSKHTPAGPTGGCRSHRRLLFLLAAPCVCFATAHHTCSSFGVCMATAPVHRAVRFMYSSVPMLHNVHTRSQSCQLRPRRGYPLPCVPARSCPNTATPCFPNFGLFWNHRFCGSNPIQNVVRTLCRRQEWSTWEQSVGVVAISCALVFWGVCPASPQTKPRTHTQPCPTLYDAHTHTHTQPASQLGPRRGYEGIGAERA